MQGASNEIKAWTRIHIPRPLKTLIPDPQNPNPNHFKMTQTLNPDTQTLKTNPSPQTQPLKQIQFSFHARVAAKKKIVIEVHPPTHSPTPSLQNPRPGTPILKPKTRDQEPETLTPNPKPRNPQPESGNAGVHRSGWPRGQQQAGNHTSGDEQDA